MIYFSYYSFPASHAIFSVFKAEISYFNSSITCYNFSKVLVISSISSFAPTHLIKSIWKFSKVCFNSFNFYSARSFSRFNRIKHSSFYLFCTYNFIWSYSRSFIFCLIYGSSTSWFYWSMALFSLSISFAYSFFFLQLNLIPLLSLIFTIIL